MRDTLPDGIRKHRAGYQVDVTEGGVRRRLTVSTLQEAVKYRTVMRAELVLEGARKRPKTLQDCYDQAMIEQWSRSKNPRAQRGTLLNAQKALTFFGAETPVATIQRADIAAYDEWLRKERGICDGTLNRYHAPLSTMLTIAEQHGWIEKRPYIRHMREGKGRIRWLSDEEEAVFLTTLAQWGAQDHRDALVVLIDTGVRPSELWELMVEDANFSWINPETGLQTGLIHLWRTKTDLPRSLPLTQRAYQVLSRRRVRGNGAFFPGFSGKNNWAKANMWLWRMWERVKMVNNITDKTLVPYCCRHTCATRLLQRGMTLPELQQWLGHTTLQMTMRYAHLAPTALVKGARLLEPKEVTHAGVGVGGDGSRSGRVAGIGRIMDAGTMEPAVLPPRTGADDHDEHGGAL